MTEPASAIVPRDVLPIASPGGVLFWGIAAVVMFGVGAYFLFATSSTQLVGGDAYNYIIAGERGLACIGVGIFCGVMIAASYIGAIFDHTHPLNRS